MEMAQDRIESARAQGRARIDGVELAFSRRGRGTPLVCLHAVGHGAEDYSDLARRFADRYELFAVDWPGHGDSGPDREPVSAAR